MKNFLSIFTVLMLLFLSSCTKESLDVPQETVAVKPEIPQEIDLAPEAAAEVTTSEKAYVTRTITVQVDAAAVGQTTYTIEVSAHHDFSQSQVTADQILHFVDPSEKAVALTFTPVTYTGSNGSLRIVFALDGRDLSGLTLRSVQDIIIQDTINN